MNNRKVFAVHCLRLQRIAGRELSITAKLNPGLSVLQGRIERRGRHWFFCFMYFSGFTHTCANGR